MLETIVSFAVFFVGIVNVIPAVLFFDSSYSRKLYGITLEGETLTILMRHRGVLLAIVGLVLISGAFFAEFRVFAIVIALISKFAFLFLTFRSKGYPKQIKQVALIDLVSVLILGIVLGVHFYGK